MTGDGGTQTVTAATEPSGSIANYRMKMLRLTRIVYSHSFLKSIT